jgi:hypothetical protein
MIDNEKIIKAAVDKFLGWQLPDGFQPDGGIDFTRHAQGFDGVSYERKPVGTNLFSADQAKAMFEYCLNDALQQCRVTIRNEILEEAALAMKPMLRDMISRGHAAQEIRDLKYYEGVLQPLKG